MNNCLLAGSADDLLAGPLDDRSPNSAVQAVRDDLCVEMLNLQTRVLLLLDRDPALRMRSAVQRLGVAEHTVRRSLAELVECGALKKTAIGTHRRFELDRNRVVSVDGVPVTVGALVDAIGCLLRTAGA